MADLRCYRCAERLERQPQPGRKPALLGSASLQDFDGKLEVEVVIYRRLGKKDVAHRTVPDSFSTMDRGRQTMQERTVGGLAGRYAVRLCCRECRPGGLQINVKRDRLRPFLAAGCETILLGPGGEVVTLAP